MKVLVVFQFIALISAALVVISVHGQTINTPCTASIISSLTPCLNFITGSSSSGSSAPTTGCCNSLKSMMSGSRDCFCLLVTANVPLQLPINRTLAIFLPRACNMEAVPIQCKASGSPLMAPGPVLPPAASPDDESPSSPQASELSATAPAPQSETSTELTAPGSPPPIDDGDDDESETPTTRSSTTSATPGIRPVLTPPPSSSASTTLSYISPTYSLLQITSTLVFLVLMMS